MAKFELSVEHDFDFELIGIASHVPDYRFCWSLNKALGFDLEKSHEDLVTFHKDQSEKARFALFFHRNPETHAEYWLISNKAAGNLLLPEVKHADFIFMVKGVSATEADQVRQKLVKDSLVLTAFHIAVDGLKNKEILLF